MPQAGPGPSDPVADAADRLRGLLVEWFTAIGPVPFVVVLVLLAAGAVPLVRRRARTR